MVTADPEPGGVIDGPSDLPRPASRCAFCGNPTGRRRLLCRGDARALTAACYGKRRHPESVAREIDYRTGSDAYLCAVCGWWHNGRDVSAYKNERVAQIAEALTAVGGDVWLALQAHAWQPRFADRREWSGFREPPAQRPADRFGTTLTGADPDGAAKLHALADRLREAS